jgi:hypothetical protein
LTTYYWGWFLVSQILADHGIAGLRDLWHAVPLGATAQEVRDAYQSLFGRPMDALIEPYVVHSEFEGLDGKQVERYHCDFALCTGKPQPWVDDTWEASGPTACEDDPEAIGPFDNIVGVIGGAPPVWRDYVLDREGRALDADPGNANVPVTVLYCALDCVQPTAFDYGQGPAPDEPWRHDRRQRVQIHSELDALPTETPVTLRYTRQPL